MVKKSVALFFFLLFFLSLVSAAEPVDVMQEWQNMKEDIFSLKSTIEFLQSRTILLDEELATSKQSISELQNDLDSSTDELQRLKQSQEKSAAVLEQQDQLLTESLDAWNSLNRRYQWSLTANKILAGIALASIVYAVVK